MDPAPLLMRQDSESVAPLVTLVSGNTERFFQHDRWKLCFGAVCFFTSLQYAWMLYSGDLIGGPESRKQDLREAGFYCWNWAFGGLVVGFCHLADQAQYAKEYGAKPGPGHDWSRLVRIW